MSNRLLWGLIGNEKIGKYSVAPKMWKELFKKKGLKVEYFILGADNSSKISLNLKQHFNNKNFVGCNIALPWKHLGYELCNYVENPANRMEAINTIIKKGHSIEGYNTDGIGMVRGIEKLTDLKNKVILILGSGSSAQTIPHHLINRDVKEIYVNDIIEERANRIVRKYSDLSRKKKVSISSVSEKDLPRLLKRVEIIINTTPCGMSGFNQSYPFNKNYIKKINKDCIIADTVYTPYLTPLLRDLKNRGNKISPGVVMLVEQAAESYFLSFGERLTARDKELMTKVALEELKNRSNKD